MNGYLANLVERILGPGPSVEPRLRSTFEPVPVMATPREEIEEGSGRETQSRTNAAPGTESVAPRREPETTDAEASKMPADAAVAKAELDTEPTLLPLRLEAQKPVTPALQKPRPSSARRALTDTDLPGSPEPAQVILSATHDERNTSERQVNEGTEMPLTPDVHQRVTRPRSITSAPVEPDNVGDNANHHQASELPPVVKVTIGRVEVRANFSPPSPAPRQSPTPRTKLCLEDYLKSRNGGGR